MRKTLISTVAAVLLTASLQAEAGGRHHHGHRHSHARIGVFIGAPLVFAPWWVESRPYYYHPAPPVVIRERVVVREPLVFYDERGNPVPPAQPQVRPQPDNPAPVWHYCPDSQAYYPYVQSCQSPWQRVLPQAPPQ